MAAFYSGENNMRQYDFRRRRSIRLKNFDYSSAGAYFFTLCVQNRVCVLGHVIDGRMELNQAGSIVSSEWLRTADVRHNVHLDEFVVMPDHFHGIIILDRIIDGPGSLQECSHPTADRSFRLHPDSLGSIIGQFKSIATKRIRLYGQHNFQWQRNYFEHIIRNEREFTAIREYIINNPIKWWYDEKNFDQWQ